MSNPETIPFSAPRSASQPWSPTDRDRLIFQWVKFDGHKQSWVATQLGMHQTTVSRIVDRYERWIAHGGPSQQGGLSRDERLRAQRWLTYERNEWVLSSALRIAGEMEQATDISKSTITHSPQDHTKETEVRTQHATLHRSGLAARFLRLAHRINMDQLKLIEQDPLSDLEPLSLEDLSPNDDDLSVCHGPPVRDDRADDASPTPDLANAFYGLAETDERTPTTPSPPPMHKTHKDAQAKQSLTDCPINDYNQNQPAKKTSAPAYAVAPYPPESTEAASVVALGLSPEQAARTWSLASAPCPP